ncbi:MAG TPA: FtsX-like permease family protein [Acidimicrobiales bacterium]|nr:FtsX-like permease family protein [Acidimicrobiales bacterium]
MSAVWYCCRRSLRTRARSYLGVALLLALLGGLTLASLAGARRTSSGYSRFREAGRALDVHVNAGRYEVEHPETAREIAGVTGTASYMSFVGGVVAPDGRVDFSFQPELVGSLDGLHFVYDRFAVTEGRLPDPARPDEVAVNKHLARASGIRLGQRLPIAIFTPEDEEAVYGDAPPPPVDRLDVTVVAVGLFPDEVVQDDTDWAPRLLLTPAFTERERRHATYAWTGVRLQGGAGDAARFKQVYAAAASAEDAEPRFRERAAVTARIQKAVRPLAVALGVFGALAGLATLLLVGQALLRLLRAERDDLAILRAVGAAPHLTSVVALPGAALSVVAGITGALLVAVLLSPLAPIGPLRRVEVDPGISFDWTVLVLGAVGFALALSAIALVAAVRQAPHRRQAIARGRVAQRSPLAGAVAAAGMPAPAVVGMRLALEPGEGRASVPVRAALGGAVVAVVALVAALVFGSSLRSLVDKPRLYGWDWDLTVVAETGYGEIDVAKAHDVLDGDPAVGAWSGAHFQSLDIEGRDVPAIGTEPGAAVIPPMLSGRSVRARDEVVLGSQTLSELDKQVGDTVEVASQDGRRRLRIVGTAVFPTVGPILGSYTTLGTGALVAYDQAPGRDDAGTGPTALFVRFREGVDREAAVARIAERLPGIGRLRGTTEVIPVQRPAEIVNYDSMGATPVILGGVLVLAAVVSLGLTLASGVGRRRRDLSLLKSLGFTRGQISATVVWQSSIVVGVGLLVGVPLGVALGRWLWMLFAARLPVLAQPAVPALLLAAIGAGLLVVANLVAAVPARSAARTPVAATLRAE